MDLTALRAEIANDPAALGYAANVTLGSDSGVAALLNAPGASRINRGIVTTEVFLSDFGAQIAAIRSDNPAGVKAGFSAVWDLLTVPRTIDYGHPVVQGALANMVAAGVGGLTSAQVSTTTTRAASRAEVLFGAGVAVSSNDVAASFGRI